MVLHPDDEPSEPPFDDSPVYRCWPCEDTGMVNQYDNRDAVVGWVKCPYLDDPTVHPPSTPEPKQITTMLGRVPGHQLDCDGTCTYGYPDGCPPF